MTEQGVGLIRPMPGDGVVAHLNGLLLVCAAAEQEVGEFLAALRETAATGGDGRALARRVAQVLARAMDRSIAGEPVPCAVAGPAGGGVAVLVSGAATATVSGGPDGDVYLAGREALTWTDRLIAGPVAKIELRLPGAGQASPFARLDSGVVPGAGIELDLTQRGDSAVVPPLPQRTPHLSAPPPQAPPHMPPPHLQPNPFPPIGPPDPLPAREPVVPPPLPPLPPLPPGPPSGPPPEPVPGPQGQGPSGPSGPSPLDPLSGPSPISPAASLPPLPPLPGPSPLSDQWTPLDGPREEGRHGQRSELRHDGPPSGPFDLPGPEAGREPPREFGRDMPRDMPQGREAPPQGMQDATQFDTSPDPGSEPGAGPMVLGVDCKNDHFNDPRVPYCAVCGIAIDQRSVMPYQGSRPPLGVLVLDDGMTLQLDSDYVLGRDPERAAEVQAGKARPARVTSPDGSVSRRHLRVALEGWDVNLIDLGSVNGTQIQPPGDPNFYDIPPEEEVAIHPGTTVRVGVSRTMRYEAHRGA
ncbi:FHA domain-containing protein [Planotetraspora kaengkrachanensis]|uniref:FHA domain-containing protein n=1 Tax=Planotetraspora kaengkrachanensis TaxID=575193 RepID=A0A8J3Q071_9ACTN|nr:FHA domain-containing protein [Planotetraspora kaengkrachanensis]GIG84339.1 hypothetical protein Pka01_74660 [Planotetraspora kaengkrachanensis]